LIDEPLHPYSEALITAVPEPDPTAEKSKVIIKGEVPNPIDLPSGCRFRTRCQYAEDVCKESEPELIEVENGRRVACHLRV
jgi:oligopeptide/dipeptide ABC transporter ATP-binding protein